MNITYTKDGLNINGELLTLEQITTGVNLARIVADGLVLMTIEWPWQRGFDGAKEQVVLSKEKAERIKEIITGVTVYFGEIAGKHSDIYGEVEENEIKISDDSQAVLSFLNKHPSRHDYNHSFLYIISDYASDGGYDDEHWTEDLIKEFSDLISSI